MRRIGRILALLLCLFTPLGAIRLSEELLKEMNTWTFKYTVTSTVRSVSKNIEVGGAVNSYHLTGEAVDFVPVGPLEEVYYLLCSKYPTSKGIGLYKTHIHFDVREKKARWK